MKTRSPQQIQPDVSRALADLGRLRGEYLHREGQLTALLAELEVELTQAMRLEQQMTPAALHERLSAIEAATTNAQKDIP